MREYNNQQFIKEVSYARTHTPNGAQVQFISLRVRNDVIYLHKHMRTLCRWWCVLLVYTRSHDHTFHANIFGITNDKWRSRSKKIFYFRHAEDALAFINCIYVFHATMKVIKKKKNKLAKIECRNTNVWPLKRFSLLLFCVLCAMCTEKRFLLSLMPLIISLI